MRHWKPIVAAVVLAALSAGGLTLYNAWFDRRGANFVRTAEFYVRPGTSPAEVLAEITEKCGVKHPRSLARCFSDVKAIVPGHYTVTVSNSGKYVSRMFAAGWQSPVKLVLSGTMRTRGAIARKIGGQMMLDSAAAASALADSALLASFGFRPADVFALIMPDTYEVYWTDSMEKILSRQKKAYDSFWNVDNREKAAALGLTPMEVSVLASIVNGETNYEKEMPSVAGVYLNRLRRGMKLQADPTVAFCFGYEPRRILKKHLEVDSPYNTYRYAGLPPGPICVPSRAALQAVLNPDAHSCLYFCASPAMDGTHLFAASYSEHLRNAGAYRRALAARASK